MWRSMCIVALALALSGTFSPVTAQSKVSTASFFGVDVGPTAETVYAGAIVALNGDLSQSGVLLRGLGVRSWYDYQAAIGNVDGRLALFDAMVGYQVMRPNSRTAIYVGFEHQDHSLSPADPNNRVVGGEGGLKVAGDFSTVIGTHWMLNVMGSYSTAFNSYWSRTRVGYNFGRFVVGPEGGVGGNEGHNEQRLGLFLDFKLPDSPIRATLSGGHHFNEQGGIFGGIASSLTAKPLLTSPVSLSVT